MSLLARADGRASVDAMFFALGGRIKRAGDQAPAYTMAGRLYLSPSGYLLLSVPNALLRGVYAALDVPGIELPPPGPSGVLEAHITVMTPDELARIGGADRVTERGKTHRYTLGRLVEFAPHAWPGVTNVYALLAHSPALQELRRSYGLSSLPAEGEHPFHVTVGIQRRGVLGRNSTAKGEPA